MRTSLSIASVFLIVIGLKLIPIGTKSESYGNYILYSEIALLPNVLVFSIICFAFLLLLVLLTNKILRQPLNGHFKLVRVNFNLNRPYVILGEWAAFVLISELYLGKLLYFFNWTSPYFFTVLITFLLYFLLSKYMIRKLKPIFISIDNNKIILKNTFWISERNISDIRTIDYNLKRNSVDLIFNEGLNNISLSIIDYGFDEISKLINEIKFVNGDKLLVGENLRSAFKLS